MCDGYLKKIILIYLFELQAELATLLMAQNVYSKRKMIDNYAYSDLGIRQMFFSKNE